MPAFFLRHFDDSGPQRCCRPPPGRARGRHRPRYDGETDQCRRDPGAFACGFVHRRVRHARGMRDEALHAAERFGKVEQQVLSDQRLDVLDPPRRSKLTIPPDPAAGAAQARGQDASAGPGTPSDRGMRVSSSRQRRGVLAARMRRDVRSPRSVRKLSNGEPVTPMILLTSPARAIAGYVRPRRVAVQVFRGRVHHVLFRTPVMLPHGDKKASSATTRPTAFHPRSPSQCRRSAAAGCSASRSRPARAVPRAPPRAPDHPGSRRTGPRARRRRRATH